MAIIKVSFLHLSPESGNLEGNRRVIEKAISIAAENRANWIVTPEMVASGYYFEDTIGTSWIKVQPDEWMNHLLYITKSRGLTLFLSYPEQDKADGKLYNSVFVLGDSGTILGKHRKIEIHPGEEEGWATPGGKVNPVSVNGISVGLLACADIWGPEHAAILKEKGADLIICPAAWGHKYGPGDRWERRSGETGIPVWVCNRTGRERNVDWTKAESVVAKDGKRLLELSTAEPSILLFNWDMDGMNPVLKRFTKILVTV